MGQSLFSQFESQIQAAKQKIERKYSIQFDSGYFLDIPSSLGIKFIHTCLFFCLAPQNAYNIKKLKPILNKISQYRDLAKKKFDMHWDNSSLLTQKFEQKDNSLTTNQILIQECIGQLTEQQCKNLITFGLADRKINILYQNGIKQKAVYIGKQRQNVKNFVYILKLPQGFVLNIFSTSDSPQQPQQTQEEEYKNVQEQKNQKLDWRILILLAIVVGVLFLAYKMNQNQML